MIEKNLDNNSNLDYKVNNWIEYFNNRGVSLELIDEYKTFIHNLISKDLPVIFELEHLSQLLGIQYSEFLKLINNSDEYYRKFDIKKGKVVRERF